MSDHGRSQRVVLARHAETAWSLAGKHTGTTDLPLTDAGREKARTLRTALAAEPFDLVLTSPLQRARVTCELAGFGDVAVEDADLVEWDYSRYEGLTTPEIRADDPGWVLWTDGAPGGESPEEVAARMDRVAHRLVADLPPDGTALVFAHGHSLRALAVRWVELGIDAGQLLTLGTGSLSTLGWKREQRVIHDWNRRDHLG